MFYECGIIKELNISNFNTSNANNMSHMFNGCCSLTHLNINNFTINFYKTLSKFKN